MIEGSISHRFAEYACPLVFEDLSKDQVQKMKTHLLDWLGTACAGKSQTPIQILLEWVGSVGGNPESTVIPNHTKSMCLFAAMVNSASSCLMEMDDLHREAIFHPGAMVIPAVLALGEKEHASGQELIVAMAVGYEVGIRVALGVGTSHYDYWHTTATCGTFGAAAGAAKMLGLDVEGFVWALGSAGTQAAGLWEFLVESTMSKPLHIGKSPMNGLLGALLAQKGFTGASRILEGEKGFFRATSQDYNEKECLAGLGQESLFDQTSLKYYASCAHTHAAIDAALLATGAKPVESGDIDEVNIYVYQAALDLLEKVEATTPIQAKFNLPFCVATALKYGRVELDDFNEEQLRNSDLRRLMERVHLHSVPEFTQNYPHRWNSRVEIAMSSGQWLDGFCEYPKGDPNNPLTEAEVLKKFRLLTRDVFSDEAAEKLESRIMDLERLDDVADLIGF